jgi:2,5-dihydroxypyridine 5,6-dioxygenase
VKHVGLAKGARVIVETLGGARPGENVLIVCDYGTTATAEALAAASVATGAETTVLTMAPRRWHNEELPPPVAGAMRQADLVLAPTRFNVGHTRARQEAQAAGARVVIIPEADDQILLNPGLSADFQKLREESEALAARLTAAEVASITSPDGTGISIGLKGRQGRALTGFANSHDVSACHCVESSIAPVEGTSEGTIVVNGSIPGVGLVTSPITVRVRDGLAYSIEGESREARVFRDLLESMDDPNVYNIGELGIGLNPKCVLENSMLSDEGVRGTIHIALGTSAYIGGKVKAAGHYDMVFKGATLELDGEVVLAGGQPRLQTG